GRAGQNRSNGRGDLPKSAPRSSGGSCRTTGPCRPTWRRAKRSSSPGSVPSLPESPCSFAPWCVTAKRSFFAVNNVYAVLYKLYEPGWFFRSTASAGMGLRLTLHRDRNRSAVELNPRNLDRTHDPARHVNENRRSHADLERSRSDNASLLKSR